MIMVYFVMVMALLQMKRSRKTAAVVDEVMQEKKKLVELLSIVETMKRRITVESESCA